jgi:hypothetical protein
MLLKSDYDIHNYLPESADDPSYIPGCSVTYFASYLYPFRSSPIELQIVSYYHSVYRRLLNKGRRLSLRCSGLRIWMDRLYIKRRPPASTS